MHSITVTPKPVFIHDKSCFKWCLWFLYFTIVYRKVRDESATPDSFTVKVTNPAG